jgi:hypothetical protein
MRGTIHCKEKSSLKMPGGRESIFLWFTMLVQETLYGVSFLRVRRGSGRSTEGLFAENNLVIFPLEVPTIRLCRLGCQPLLSNLPIITRKFAAEDGWD